MKIYEKLIRPILWRIEPEKAHNLTISSQIMLRRLGLRKILKAYFSYKHPALKTKLWGIDFENPIGLPAGCDKKGTAINMWEAYGFGFATAGSITNLAQPGNEKPRVFRLKEDEAFQVNFGLNSIGAEAMKEVLKNKKTAIPYGISVARSTAICDDSVAEDYVKAFELLYEFPDYFEINISCPNIPDTDYFKRGDFLKVLLSSLQQKNPLNKPLLLKIGVDIIDDELDFIIENIINYNIHGIIVSNLIKDTSRLETTAKFRKGGVSGKLLESYSNEILAKTYQKTKGKIPLIGLGGIFSAEDAYKKIKLGASMVQVYTGMVFKGPGLIKKISKDLVKLLKKDGFTHISEAVGSAFR